MAAKKTPAPKRTSTDVRGLTRLYIDIPTHLNKELGILAIRLDMSKRALLAQLVENAVSSHRASA
jgi:hypothetical protein